VYNYVQYLVGGDNGRELRKSQSETGSVSQKKRGVAEFQGTKEWNRW